MSAPSIKKILFITSTRLGDAILSTGLLDYLLKTYPDARFTIACGPVAASLFDSMPRRDQTIIMYKYRYDLHWLILWKKCLFSKWDWVVDLRGSALSFFLWTKKRSIIKGGRQKERRIEYLAKSFSLSTTPLPVVWIGEKEQVWAKKRLPFDCYIAIAPTANWQGKIWPIDRFIGLIQSLINYNSSFQFVIIYGPGKQERKMVEPLFQTTLPVIDMGGQNSIVEVAALLSRCSGFIGNDSGLMHLAAACQIPTLGLFGPSKAAEYAPSGKFAQAIVASGEEGKAAMENLSIHDVFIAFKALLETSKNIK